MTLDRTASALLNSAVAASEYVARAVAAFAVTPALVGALGPAGFGVWQMLDRLGTYVAAMDGRSSQVLKWIVATSPDTSSVRQDVGAAVGVWLAFLPIFVAGGALLVWLAPRLAPGVPPYVVRVTAAVVLGYFAVASLAGTAEAAIRGANLAYREAWIVTVGPILTALLLVLVLSRGYGLISVAIIQLITATLTAVALWRLAYKIIPSFGIAVPSRERFVTYLHKSVWFLGWHFVDKSLVALDVVICGIVLGAASAGRYVVTGYITVLAVNVVVLWIGAASPGLGQILAARDSGKMRNLRRELYENLFVIAATVGTVIIVGNGVLVSSWVGAEMFSGRTTTFLMVVAMTQWLFIKLDGSLIDLTLDLRVKVLAGALSALLSGAIGYVLALRFGPAGVCAGLIIGRLPLSIVYPIQATRIVGSAIIAQGVATAARRVAVLSFVWGVAATLKVSGLGTFLLVSGISGILAAAAALWLGLDTSGRSRLRLRTSALSLAFGVYRRRTAS